MKYLLLASLGLTPLLATAADLTDFSHSWKLDPAHSDSGCYADLDAYYSEESQSLNFQYSSTAPNGTSGGIVENFKLGRTVRADLDNDIFDVSLKDRQLEVVRSHTGRTIIGKKTKVIETITFSLQSDYSLGVVRTPSKKAATKCLYLPVYPEVMGKTVTGVELILNGRSAASCAFDAAGKCDLGKYVVARESQAQLMPNQEYGSLVIERKTPRLYVSVHYTISYVVLWVDNSFGGTTYQPVDQKQFSTPYSDREIRVGNAVNGYLRYIYE